MVEEKLIDRILNALRHFSSSRKDRYRTSIFAIALFSLCTIIIILCFISFVLKVNTKENDIVTICAAIVSSICTILTTFGFAIFKPNYDNQLKVEDADFLIKELENCQLKNKTQYSLFFEKLEKILDKFY